MSYEHKIRSLRRFFRLLPWNLLVENRRLRAKLAETRRHLRAASRGAERNAIVCQLMAARAVIRRHHEETKKA